MGAFDDYPPQVRAILEKVAAAGYREVLVDQQAGSRFIYDRLAESADDSLRELGEQMRDGALDGEQLARSSFYRPLLDGGLAALSQMDIGQIAAEAGAEPVDRPDAGFNRDDGDNDRNG